MLNSPIIRVMSGALSKCYNIVNGFFYDVQSLQSSERDLLGMTKNFIDKLHSNISAELSSYSFSGIDTWLIYPIDDPVAFSRAIPMFCMLVAALKDGKVVAVVSLMPIFKEVFMVEVGKGVFMEDISGNVCRLRVSRVNIFSKALVGCVNDNYLLKDTNKRLFSTGMTNVFYVASGRLDACLMILKGAEGNNFAIMGDLVVSESRGKTSVLNHRNNPNDKSLDVLWAASNGFLHDELMSVLKIENQ